MRVAALVLLLSVAPFSGCLDGDAPPPASEAGMGPAWAFVDTDGIEHSRDAPEGNATMLFFMASWCGTCRSKTGMLAEVHGDYAAQGVRFYSVSFDPSDNDGSLAKWKEQYRNDWPHGVDPNFDIQRTFGITSQSSVVVLDSHGEVVQKWGYGGPTESGLREALDRALADAA